jgi:hypothetical protein
MARKKKEQTIAPESTLHDPCPLVNLFDSRQKAHFIMNGMGFVIKNFPELRKHCRGCEFCKDIPPDGYACRRFYFTTEFIDEA